MARRRKRRNGWALDATFGNPKRRRKGRRVRSRGRRRGSRAKRRNPAVAITKGLTAGFSMDLLKKAVPIVLGGVANAAAGRLISKQFPQVGEGYPSVAASLATSGMLGMVPKYGSGLFVGGVVQSLAKGLDVLRDKGVLRGLGFSSYPGANASPEFYRDISPDMPEQLPKPMLDGLNDFLVQSQVDSARQMGQLPREVEEMELI